MEQNVTWRAPKKIFFFIASLLFLVGLLILSSRVDSVVKFADPNLEKAVREKINQPKAPITRLDVLAITELNVSGRGIRRLEGIESLKRLAELNLANNAIEDLSPLADLGMLVVLNLENNQISDLETVRFDEITHLGLHSLSLRRNVTEGGKGLSDISLIGEMAGLDVLDLGENHITDIGPLAGLIRLRELDLRENNLSEIGPLSGLKSMEKLNLRANYISDITTLREFKALQELNIRENQVQDITPVEGLVNLVYLNIHSNPVRKGVPGLSKLEKLETLIMRNVFIGEDFHFLGYLTKLQQLNIRNSAITDVSAIGELMRNGALQDNAEEGIQASIDLLEINPLGNGRDPYLNMRRYWDNISSRFPINLPYYPSAVHSPVFSHQGGFYEDGFYLTLSSEEPGGKIYYTLDGSEPSLTPRLESMGSTQTYTGAFFIDSRAGEPNRLSKIETSRGIEYRPPGEVFKINIVRAVAVDETGNRSNVLTHTYFIDKKIAVRYTFPLVSIVTDSDNLFNDEIGIYVPGNIEMDPNIDMGIFWWYPANFVQRGLKWERPVSFQVFSSNGELLIAQNLGMRIHGGATRYFNPKSFRLYARPEYDEQGLIKHNFFSKLGNSLQEKTIDSYKTLVFRSGGNDESHALFRDVLAQSLLQNTGLDIQKYQPAIIFINGEYWGIHNIRTRYDEHYFQNHYGLAANELLVLENGQVQMGDVENMAHYANIFSLIDENYIENNYLTKKTLAEDKAYQAFAARVDIENFAAYYAAQIYFNNGDWPQNNAPIWAKVTSPQPNSSYGHDGKWRWMVLDVDFTFSNPSFDSLSKLINELNSNPAAYLFRSLLENQNFRYQFINKFADYLNTIFREDIVVRTIDELEMLYSPEIEEHIHRWGTLGGSLDSWLQNVDETRQFALLRPNYQRQHIVEYFGLSGTATVNLQTHPAQGYIQINTIDIREGVVGVDDPANWSGIYFQDVPVKITAVPGPGYRFVRWEEIGSEDAELVLVLTEDITLTAEFEKED